MVKSFDQKAAVWWSIVKHDPKISHRAMQRRTQKTGYGMGNQDGRSLLRHLKDANELRVRNANSNMRTNRDKYGVVMKDSKGKALPDGTQERLARGAYQSAKRQSRKGVRDNPLKKGCKFRTIRSTIESIYSGAPMDGYYEFATTP